LLALLGREVPEMPCELMFSRWECSLLERLQPLVAPERCNAPELKNHTL
jgi:hypothetical protein